jgi:DNA polymerase IV
VGLHFYTLAQAEDPRLVSGRRTAKSIGSERTVDKDVSEKAEIKLHLRRSAETICRRLRQKNYVAFGVCVKLKTSDFQILTRQRSLNEPTDVAERLYAVGVDLLREFDHPGPFRLVGMAAFNMVGNDAQVQPDLFGSLARQLEVAIDELSHRFGANMVCRASDLTQGPALRLGTTLDYLEDGTGPNPPRR